METSGRKKRILVVEDEPSINRICVRSLAALGFDVDTADNGRTAMAMLLENSYDLYLSDIRMPDTNGMDLYKSVISRKPEYINRVLFTTGDTLNTTIQSFLQDTKRPVLPKPFTPDDLRIMVLEELNNNEEASGESETIALTKGEFER